MLFTNSHKSFIVNAFTYRYTDAVLLREPIVNFPVWLAIFSYALRKFESLFANLVLRSVVFPVHPQHQHLLNAPKGEQVSCPADFLAVNVQSLFVVDAKLFRKKPVDYWRAIVDHWNGRWIPRDAKWMYWSVCLRGAEFDVWVI